MKGQAVVWGMRDVKPIVNIPSDALKVRLRLRANSFGAAFVRFRDRIEHWVLQPVGPGVSGDWKLGVFVGANHRRAIETEGRPNPIE